MDYPSSDALMHAGCEITVSFSHACTEVKDEVMQRIQGQYDMWHDPHNNGTYSTTSAASDSVFNIERLTGDGKYIDKIRFTFTSFGDSCKLEACSQSQVTSLLDFSTNYCNSHDLYCAEEGCRPFKELKYTEAIGKCTQSSDDCTVV